jgi:H+/Cl- antiporter ClcA
VLCSAFLANLIAGICGAQHSKTLAPEVGLPSAHDLVALISLSAACGVATGAFHRILAYLASKKAETRSAWLAPTLASFAIALLISLIPNGWDFCGLGAISYVPDSASIQSMLQTGFAPRFAWFWKGVFTMITLGAGLRGGEVTPLFFMGSALGIHLAETMSAPADMGAATGLCLMFAAGLQAPVTASVMALELFGWEASLAVAVSAKLSASVAKKIAT